MTVSKKPAPRTTPDTWAQFSDHEVILLVRRHFPQIPVTEIVKMSSMQTRDLLRGLASSKKSICGECGQNKPSSKNGM